MGEWESVLMHFVCANNRREREEERGGRVGEWESGRVGERADAFCVCIWCFFHPRISG